MYSPSAWTHDAHVVCWSRTVYIITHSVCPSYTVYALKEYECIHEYTIFMLYVISQNSHCRHCTVITCSRLPLPSSPAHPPNKFPSHTDPLSHYIPSKQISLTHILYPLCVCLVPQSCLTLCNPMERSLPGSSVHGILQARIVEWVTISFCRASSQPRDQTQVSCIAGWFFTVWTTREAWHSTEIYLNISP